MFLQKVEGRVASDQELKLTELLRYYMRDIQAAKVRHIHLLPSFCMHTCLQLISTRLNLKNTRKYNHQLFTTHQSCVELHRSLDLFQLMFNLGTCQDLLYRRARALADYENSNKALDKARLKSKDIPQAEEHQQQCLKKFDKLSESGKKGLCIHP